MALPAFNGQAQDLEGDAIPGVKVEVRREVGGQPLASIFSDRDGVSGLGNPFTTNVLDNGRFRFHAAAGVYQVRVFTDAGFEAIWRHVAIQELVAPAGAVTDGHGVVWDGATGLALKSLDKYPFFSRQEDVGTTPRTLTASEVGTLFVNFGADRAVTLPAIARGRAFAFYTLAGNLTVNTNGGSLLFEDGTSAVSVVMSSDSRMIIIADNANWVVFASNFNLRAASETVRGAIEHATIAEIRSAAAGNLAVTADKLETAAAIVSLVDAPTIAVDWDAGINFIVGLAANRVLGNPSNGQVGTWRTVRVAGNDSTPRTLAFGSQYTGALPTLTDISNGKQYLLSIFCYGPGQFMAKATQLFP